MDAKAIGRAASRVMTALGDLVRAIADLVMVALGGAPGTLHLEGGEFMYSVKDDNPDVRYSLAPITVTDAEGAVVTGAVVEVVVESDNPSAVAVTPDADPHGGLVHFGAPNPDGSPAVANMTATYKVNGVVLAIKGAQINVSAGDAAAVAGGDIVLEGLTETPPPPPPVG